jgi:hypothetical protein
VFHNALQSLPVSQLLSYAKAVHVDNDYIGLSIVLRLTKDKADFLDNGLRCIDMM